MRLSYRPFELEFKHPFGVSSNTRTHTPTVFTKIEVHGFAGYGEACLPPYLGETTESTIAFLEKVQALLKRFLNPLQAPEILMEVDKLSEGNNAAKASVDIALNDLIGKIAGRPFYDIMGFNRPLPTPTACTIGISGEKETAQKIKEANDFSILKIKAGTENDKALVELIRKYTNKPIYIDVNQGWKDKYFVVDMLHWLKEQNVVLVEQPMPVDKTDDMAWVLQKSPLPLIADESIKRYKDLDKIKGCFSGINIKLMKSTGLIEAHRMINYARQNNLKVLLGCMAESSCGASAMAQLMSLGDHVDLDAPNLLKNDPFSGITYTNGKITLTDLPGIGAIPKIPF